MSDQIALNYRWKLIIAPRSPKTWNQRNQELEEAKKQFFLNGGQVTVLPPCDKQIRDENLYDAMQQAPLVRRTNDPWMDGWWVNGE